MVSHPSELPLPLSLLRRPLCWGGHKPHYPKAGIREMALLPTLWHLVMVCHPEISAALSLLAPESSRGCPEDACLSSCQLMSASLGKGFWWKLRNSPLGLGDFPHIKARTVIYLTFLVQMPLACLPTLLPLLSEIISLVTVSSLIILGTDYYKWQGEITPVNCFLCSPVFIPSLRPAKRKRGALCSSVHWYKQQYEAFVSILYFKNYNRYSWV